MRGNPVRKTVTYGAAGAALCAVAVLAWAFTAPPERWSWPTDGWGTLLWVLEGETPDGLGVAAMGVVGLSPAGNVVISLPADVSVKGPRGRLVELGDVGEIEGWPACCDAVESLLGVPVSGYVVATSDDVARFCDGVGPIELDVPADVICRSDRDAEAIEIKRGSQKVSGRDLLAYVFGASQEARIERLERVLRAVQKETARAGESSAALVLRSSLRGRETALVWDALARDAAPLRVRELPTTVTVQDGVARRVALAVETEKLVTATVRGQATLTAEDISVVALNGSGARLAATRAASYLGARGFRVTRVGNADSFTYGATTVVSLTQDAKAWMLRDALPGAARVVTAADFGARLELLKPLIPSGVDVVLIVGAGMEFE